MIHLRTETVPTQYGYRKATRLYIFGQHWGWDKAFAVPAIACAVILAGVFA